MLRWRRASTLTTGCVPRLLTDSAGAVEMPTEPGAVFSATHPHPPSCDPVAGSGAAGTFALDSIPGVFHSKLRATGDKLAD